MVQHTQDSVIIEDRTDIKNFLVEIESGLKGIQLTNQQTDQISAVLSSLVDHEFNKTDGKVRVRIGHYHFPLRRTLYTGFTNVLLLGGGVLATMIDPVSGGMILSGTALAAIQQVGDLFTTLKDDQIIVLEGVTSLVREKSKSGQQERATAAEVERLFDSRKSIVSNVPARLLELKEKGILGASENGTVQYWIKQR